MPPVDELRAFVGRTLPAAMVPAPFVELSALPLLPNGKVDRKELGRRPIEALRSAAAAAPRDGLEIALVGIWEELLDVRPIGVRDNFFELGGHSLAAVRLLAVIAERLGRELPLAALFRAATIEALAGRLQQQTSAPASCLVPLQPQGKRPPLFCVHPAGGNVFAFLPLARELGPEQPFYALQSRDLEDEAEPFAEVREMAAHYLEEVRAVDPEGPYYLAGCSFGGLVAFEMARQLEQAGREVACVVLLDTGAPAAVESEADYEDDAFWLFDVLAFLSRLAGREPPVRYDELRALEPAAQVQCLLAGLREIDFLPPGAGELQVRRLLRVYKANVRAGGRYRPGLETGNKKVETRKLCTGPPSGGEKAAISRTTASATAGYSAARSPSWGNSRQRKYAQTPKLNGVWTSNPGRPGPGLGRPAPETGEQVTHHARRLTAQMRDPQGVGQDPIAIEPEDRIGGKQTAVKAS